MAHVLVLVALVILVRIAGAFGVETDGPFDSLTLLALGFVLVGGHAMGELFRRARLPALLGYLAAGIVFGPDLSELALGHARWAPMSDALLGELGLVNTLAVGVIGTLGGSEIKLADLEHSFGKVVAICGCVFVLVLPSIVLIVLGASFVVPSVVPFLAQSSLEVRLAAAMIFGALAIGMSPAATLALLQEVRARGRFTSLVLGVVVLGDLLLVATFLLMLALAKLLLSPEGFTVARVVVELPVIGMEFGYAIGLGGALGMAFIAYLRFVGREVLLFSLAAIFATSYVAAQLHAETLLTFLVAGFVVQNFSKHGHALGETFERVSLPVFVVYFTAQAASLDLAAVSRYLPLTILLVGVRCGLFVAGIRLGARLARIPSSVVQQLQVSFFSQGGVDLVLAAMVAESLPGVGPEIRTVTVATVLFYVIGGPPLLARALERVGESAAARERGVRDLEDRAPTKPPAEPSPSAGAIATIEVDDPRLAAEANRLRALVEFELGQGFVGRTQRRAASRRVAFRNLLDDVARACDEAAHAQGSTPAGFDALVVAHVRRLDGPGRAPVDSGDLAELFERIDAAIPFGAQVRTTMEAGLLVPRGGPMQRIARRCRRWGVRVLGRNTRTVPLGRLWRYHVALHVPVALWAGASASESAAWRSLFEHVRAARARIEGGGEHDPVALREQHAAILHALEVGDSAMHRAASEALVASWDAFAQAVLEAGTLESPAWRRRPSTRHDAARAAVAELAERFESDDASARGRRDALRAWFEAHHLVSIGRQSVQHLDEQLETSLRELQTELHGLARSAEALTDSTDVTGWNALTGGIDALTDRLTRLRRGATDRPLHRSTRLAEALLEVPDLLQPSGDPTGRPDVAAVLDLRAWLELSLVRRLELVRSFAEDELAEGLPSIRILVSQARRVVDYHLDLAPPAADDGLGARVATLLEQANDELGALATATIEQVRASVEEAEREALEPIDGLRWTEVRRRSRRASDGPPTATASRLRREVGRRASAFGLGVAEFVEGVRALLENRPTSMTRLAHRALLMGPRVHLPEAYERLFTSVPAESVGLVVHRPELDALRTAVSPWRRGGAGCSVVLHADRGAGKRTLVRQLLEDADLFAMATWIRLAPGREDELRVAAELASPLLGRVPQHRDGLDFASLAAQVDRIGGGGRALVIIENGERLFRRSRLGVATMRRFVGLVEATSPSVQWVVMMAEPSYRLLDSMLGLGTRFDVALHLPPADDATLRQILDRRHRLSGYPLYAGATWPSLHEWLRSPGSALRAVRDPEQALYRRLRIASGGNVRHALRVWLASARRDEQGRITLDPIPTEPCPLLEGVSERAKFVLCTLLALGPMPARELDDDESIGELRHRRLIETDSEAVEPVLAVPTRLVFPLTRELREDMLL